MKKEIFRITIETMEIQAARDFSTYSGPIYNNRNKWARTQSTYLKRTILVNGVTEKGEKIYFWTPANEIIKTTGMLDYESLTKDGGGFWTETGNEFKTHKSCFENDKIMPVVIENKSRPIPKIKKGDKIEVEANLANVTKTGILRINRVKLLQIIEN